MVQCIPVPEFIDPVFTKTSPKRSFSLNRKGAFWLVFAKTGSIISGTGDIFRASFKFFMGDKLREKMEGGKRDEKFFSAL
jgi:hypothetical protein